MFKKKQYNYQPAKSLKLNSYNDYPLLIPNDTLCKSTLTNLAHAQFLRVLQKAVRDLNLLLHMTDSQFWRQLAQNETLKTCLQSCLAVFSKRQYDTYQQHGENNQDDMPSQNSSFAYYSFLLQTVLFIYFRISEAHTDKQKSIVVDEWLLDVPKMLDLAGIYGESNFSLVKKIIENAYQRVQILERDTQDFFHMIRQHQLFSAHSQNFINIDFTEKSLRAKNFGNREAFMMIQTTKEFFKVKDLLTNMLNFLNYFPKKYAHELATDCKIQGKLLKKMTLFLKESQQQWKLEGYIRYFEIHFEDIQQLIASYFTKVMSILKNILKGLQTGLSYEIAIQAQYTYETLCQFVVQSQYGNLRIYMKKILSYIFEECQENFFFQIDQWPQKLDSQSVRAIQKCIKCENKYKKQKKLAGKSSPLQQTYEKYKQTLKKYDQIITQQAKEKIRQLQQQRQAQRLKRELLTGETYWTLSQMKHAPMSIEYQDQPEQNGQFYKIQYVEPLSSTPSFNLSVFPSSSEGKDGDQELSIWNKSQVSESNNENKGKQVQIAQKQSNFGIQLTKQIKKSTNLAPLKTIVNKNKQNNQKNKQLSVFNDEKQNKNGLSFSMISQIGAKDQKLYQNMSITQAIDQEDLVSMLEKLQTQITYAETGIPSRMNPSIKVKEINYSQEDNLDMSEWENDSEPSFEISSH